MRLTTLAILMFLTLGFPYFAVWTVWGESLPQVAAIEIDLL